MYIKTNTYNKITSFGKNKLYFYITVSSYQTEEDMNNFENVLTETNLSDFQDLYDASKSHQELLNILKLKVYDYLAQAKKIREALPAVFGKLEGCLSLQDVRKRIQML